VDYRSTRVTKHLICARLPPPDTYLDYLSHRYAIRLLFLPRDHIIQFPPHKPDSPKLTLPTSTRLYNNIAHYTILPLENRSTSAVVSIQRIHIPEMKKDDRPQVIHQEWIKPLPDNTILCYRDGSRLDNGQVGSGFAYYQVSKGKTIKLSSHYCHLGGKVEVYDAELHAFFEAPSQINIHHPNLTKVHIILCIDNTTTIETLSSDTHSHQYARQTIEEMNTLVICRWYKN
jgi:hypothetical protein